MANIVKYFILLILLLNLTSGKFLKSFIDTTEEDDQQPQEVQLTEEEIKNTEPEVMEEEERKEDEPEPKEEETTPKEEETTPKEEETTPKEEETTPREEEARPEEEDQKQEEEKDKSDDDTKYINVKCLWVNKYNVYSLQKLQNKEEDYVTQLGENKGEIIYNFCQNTITRIDSQPSNSTFLWKTNTSLIRISGPIAGDGKTKNIWKEFVDDDGAGGVSIEFTDGEKCDDYENQHTILKVYCDPEGQDEDFINTVNVEKFFGNNKCRHIISIKSIYGCTLSSFYLLNRLLNDFKYVFGTVFIIIGLFLCLWGKKFTAPTIILITGLIGCFIITLAVLNFLPSLITTEKKLLYLMGIGLVLGFIAGFLLKGKVKVYVIMLGATTGYSAGTFVYQFVQTFITYWDPQYLYYATIAVCCITGALLALFMLKVVLIIGTSFLGGYIAMRGFSVILGNYMDEQQLIDLIKNDEYEQIKEIKNYWTFIYLAIWAVFTIFGVCYQCKFIKRKSNDYVKQK